LPHRSEKIRDRLALRASTTFFLRSVETLSRTVGHGDILRGVIFLSIVDANTRELRPDTRLSQAYSEAGDTVPDTLRRPISVHALALALALPYETTRRHVNRLIEDGLCVRTDNGIMIPGAVLGRETMTAGLRKNFEDLQQLFGELRAGGVDLTT
jgi:hypothetical protein